MYELIPILLYTSYMINVCNKLQYTKKKNTNNKTYIKKNVWNRILVRTHKSQHPSYN